MKAETIRWTQEDYKRMLPFAVEAMINRPDWNMVMCFESAQHYVMPADMIKKDAKRIRIPDNVRDAFWSKFVHLKTESPGPLFDTQQEENTIKLVPKPDLQEVQDSLAELSKKVHGLIGLYSKTDQILNRLSSRVAPTINVLIVDSPALLTSLVLGQNVTNLERVGTKVTITRYNEFTQAANKRDDFKHRMEKYHVAILAQSLAKLIRNNSVMIFEYRDNVGFAYAVTQTLTLINMVNKLG